MANGKPDCSETDMLKEAYFEYIDSLSVSISEVNTSNDKENIEANYNKVIKNLIFQEGDFVKEEKKSIIDAIKNLYYGSEKAREVFNKIGDLKKGEGAQLTGGFYITNGFYDDPKHPHYSTSSSDPGKYSIMIDVKRHGHCDSIHAFNDKEGDYILMSLERTIMHETIHAVTGITDESYKTTHAPTGEVVDWTNEIMKELNTNHERPTYEVEDRVKDEYYQKVDPDGHDR